MADTRQRLLSTTAELFQRQGFNGTSIKQITQLAEVTTGSLYHFFPGGKDELAAEVVRTSGAEYLELFQLIAGSGVPAPEAVGLLFDGAADTLERSGFVDACPIYTVALEVASANDALRVACDDVFRSWTTTASTLLRDFGYAAERADVLAITIVAALGGAFVLARTAQDATQMRGIGADMSRLVLAGAASS